MKKYDYKIITPEEISPEDLEKELKKLGKQGWDLSFVKNNKFNMFYSGDFYIILKREIEPKEGKTVL